MTNDLTRQVIDGLQARKGEWKQIAAALAPEVSYSMISQLGRGKYKSEPSYRKLRMLAEYLRPTDPKIAAIHALAAVERLVEVNGK